MAQPGVAQLVEVASTSEARSLHQLAFVAARSIPGCAAANVAKWDDDELVLAASTHPDLAALLSVQATCRRGPALDALAQREPVSSPDLLAEERWPEFTAAALAVGARCCVSVGYLAESDGLSMTLAGVRPRSLDPRRAEPAEMLAAVGAAMLGAVSQFGDALRTAGQLEEAAAGRAIVDQAKGILMQALACTADEALERIRHISQRSNVRVIEVARDIVDRAGRPGLRQATHEAGHVPPAE